MKKKSGLESTVKLIGELASWSVNVRASLEPRSVRSLAPSTHAHTFTHQPRSLHYKCLEISLMRGSSFSLPSAQGTQDENATSINEWSPGSMHWSKVIPKADVVSFRRHANGRVC